MNARSLTLSRQIAQLISGAKHIPMSRLTPNTDLYRQLGFDLKDVVDVIFLLEHHFGIQIPDEVPVEKLADLIRYVATASGHRQAAA